MAASPNVWVVLYQLYDAEESGTDSIAFGPYRLAFTKDAGNTWVFVDSLIYRGRILQELSDKTDFGYFSSPANMTEMRRIGWSRLFHMLNDSIAIVQSLAYGTVNGNKETHYYIGRLNLNSMTAVWTKLPFVESLFPPSAAPYDFQIVNDTTIFMVQAEFVDVINNPDDLKWKVWKSENVGRTWTSHETPPWIDYRSLRFLSNTHGVAANAVTNDGGETWAEWGHPFGSNPLFYAVDSTHYKLANRFSLFASSEDAGRSWSHNEAGGIPLAVSAYEGNVLVGRNYQSLAMSPDSGETWRDVGAEGKLPPRLSQVIAVAHPDPATDANRIIGIGTFVEYDATFKVAVIESNDGGETWSVGQQLPELIGSVGKVKLVFVGDPLSELGPITGFLYGSKGLMISENEGVTWTMQNNTLSFEQLGMATPLIGGAITSDGIYTTTDGGKNWRQGDTRTEDQNTSLGITPFVGNNYGALFSDKRDKNAPYRNWSYEESQSAGTVWNAVTGTNAPRSMDIGAFWGDSANVHVVGRAGVILYSSDAARTFRLENDSVPSFVGFVRYVEAGKDADNIYVVAPGNEAGRFFVYRERPTSVPFSDPAVESAYLTANPVRGGEALLNLTLLQSTDISIRLYDMVGRPVIAEEQELRGAGSYRIALNLSEVVSGRYTVEIATRNGAVHLPLVVVK